MWQICENQQPGNGLNDTLSFKLFKLARVILCVILQVEVHLVVKANVLRKVFDTWRCNIANP